MWAVLPFKFLDYFGDSIRLSLTSGCLPVIALKMKLTIWTLLRQISLLFEFGVLAGGLAWVAT
jgi:hypothetical protein